MRRLQYATNDYEASIPEGKISAPLPRLYQDTTKSAQMPRLIEVHAKILPAEEKDTSQCHAANP